MTLSPDALADRGALRGEVANEPADTRDPRAVDIAIEVADDVPPVTGDRIQLSQALHNLIGNAMKYGRAGTPVKIDDLARTMIRLSGLEVCDEGHPEGDIAIEYIGLRRGEKLYEELLIGENTTGTNHPRIFKNSEPILPYDELAAALERLARLWDMIESLELPDQFEIDLGDVSRLDYYTGLTFRIYIEGCGSRIGSGGRYDSLTARVGKAEPAVRLELELEGVTGPRVSVAMALFSRHRSCQRVGEVVEDVVEVLDADADAHQAG